MLQKQFVLFAKNQDRNIRTERSLMMIPEIRRMIFLLLGIKAISLYWDKEGEEGEIRVFGGEELSRGLDE